MPRSTPDRLYNGGTPVPGSGSGQRDPRKASPGSAGSSRGEKLAQWDASVSPGGGEGGGSGRGGSGRRSEGRGSGRRQQRRRRYDDSSDSVVDSSDDSDELNMSESDEGGGGSGAEEEEDDLANVDDVAAAMRSPKRAGPVFNRDWEDLYLADELRMKQRERDPTSGNDGLPPDCVVVGSIALFAILIGLAAHFLLKANGYHDLAHEDIMELEL